MGDIEVQLYVLNGILGCLTLSVIIYFISRCTDFRCTDCRKRSYRKFDNEDVIGTPGTFTRRSQEESITRELPAERKRSNQECNMYASSDCQEENNIGQLQTRESMSTERLQTKHRSEMVKQLDQNLTQIRSLEAENSKLKQEKGDALERLEHSKEQNQKLKQELQKEKTEKEDALRRLSALMSNRLRDGNPNVVDLSDQNRPLKVGEQFSELYDNQWTDAFSAVQVQFGDKKTEMEVIQILLEIVEQCFEMCKWDTKTAMSQLQTGVDEICKTVAIDGSKLAADLMQRIKEERKLNAAGKIPDFKKAIERLKKYNFASSDVATCFDNETVGFYVKECLKLCHLMVNQDPPMVIESKPDSSNAENFKAYQNRGKHIAYVVWPILFLHEGGPLVSKGVAEFRN